MVIQSRAWYYAIGGLAAGLLLGVAWGIFRPKTTSAPTVHSTNTTNTENVNTSTNTTVTGVTSFSTLDLPDRDPAFDFSAEIPTTWAVEYVAASQAIAIYDPRGDEETPLANAKIFIRYFSASEFQTLTTVEILARTEATIAGRPAVTYLIKKKASVADFPHQPAWRNGQHRVTDIRVADTNPSTFYVFAQAPDVSDGVFDAFLASLQFPAN